MIFQSSTNYRRSIFRVSLIILLLFLIVASVVTYHSIRRTGSIPFSLQPREIEKQVALTFDDGPDPKYTAEIIEILKREGVPATFFFTGEHMLEHPEVVTTVFNEGFLIGNHSYSHSYQVHRSPERLAWELHSTNRVLEQLTGHQTILYRAPFLLDYENVPDELIPADQIHEDHPIRWAHNEGFINVSAFVDGFDYEAKHRDQIVRNIESQLQNGHIILLHDGGGDRSPTVAALPVIISVLRHEGYELVGLDELLNQPKSVLMPPAPTGAMIETVSLGFMSSLATTFKRYAAILIEITLILSFARLVTLLFFRFFPAPRRLRRPWAAGVSVIVPAYNEVANIEATIRSIMGSTHTLFEVLVINDGSTDATAKVVRRLANEFPGKITLISKPNGGKASALNVGAIVAQYPVLVAVDADTILHPEAICRLASYFHDARVGAVAGTVEVAGRRGLMSTFQRIEYITSQAIEKQAFHRMMCSVGVIPGAIGAWRRSDLLAVGGYSQDTLVEDQDLTMAMHTLGKEVRFAPDALACTEVPDTVRNFVKQRKRWIFGGIQCLWKYKYHFFSWRSPQLGFVILPFNLVFSILLPLLSPLIDIIFVYQFFFGSGTVLLQTIVALLIVDVVYVGVALLWQRAPVWLLLFVPFQRVFYRFTISYILIVSLVKAIEGSQASWGSLLRSGAAAQAFTEWKQLSVTLKATSRAQT